MKRFLTLFLIGVITIILSGCSLPSVNKNSFSQDKFTFSKNIWKSVDGGKTWEAKNTGIGKANTTNVDVLSMAIDPYDSQNIFVGLRQGGIMESTNGGDDWKFLNFHSIKVYGLALSPDDPKIIYASGVFKGRGKIFKSIDKGKTWQEIYTSSSVGPLIISLIIDSQNPKIIYASNSINEVFKSSDRGVSWKKIYSASAPVIKIALDGKESNLIYCITNSGLVYRSQNGGADFTSLNKKINQTLSSYNYLFNDLKTSKSNSQWVYLAGKGGIIQSKDAGEHWKKINTLNDSEKFPVNVIAIDPKKTSNLVYGSSQAIYQSINGGLTWATFQFDTKMLARTLVYDPLNPKIIYLGFSKK